MNRTKKAWRCYRSQLDGRWRAHKGSRFLMSYGWFSLDALSQEEASFGTLAQANEAARRAEEQEAAQKGAK